MLCESSETNLGVMSTKGWGAAMKIAPREARVANFSDEVQKNLLVGARDFEPIFRRFSVAFPVSSI